MFLHPPERVIERVRLIVARQQRNLAAAGAGLGAGTRHDRYSGLAAVVFTGRGGLWPRSLAGASLNCRHGAVYGARANRTGSRVAYEATHAATGASGTPAAAGRGATRQLPLARCRPSRQRTRALQRWPPRWPPVPVSKYPSPAAAAAGAPGLSAAVRWPCLTEV